MKSLLILTIFFTFSQSEDTQSTKLCKWQAGVKQTAETKLKPLVGKSFKATDVSKQYSYDINICDSSAPGEAQYNAVVQKYDDKDKKKKQHVVKVGDMRSADLSAGTDWVMLWFYNGTKYNSHCDKQNRSAVIMIKCDSWAGTGKALALEENINKTDGKCHYLFEITSALVCPKQGLSAGSIFVVIFFFVVAIYLIGGFLYQRCVNNAQGWDQFPNHRFWINFGNLQADGCDLLCRCGSRQESKQYRNIDEAIAGENHSSPQHQEPARDDRLLSM